MSGLAGILNRNGRAVRTVDLAAMTAAMPERGLDGVGHWIAGEVALGHCQRRTTFPSLAESQPVQSDRSQVSLTLDGRIDNRTDLARALGDARLAQHTTSDAELVLRCYEKWGTECFSRLLGDFALAIWDAPRRSLICARDFLGKRPFYYCSGPASFRFASEIRAVLADTSISREPNEGMIGEFLAVELRSNTETLFRQVHRLPPAHFMEVSPRGIELTRYWDWKPHAEIRYRTEDEYAEHLRHLVTEAVESRLPSPWPLAASLSGGVDSSSVIGLIAELRRRGRFDGTTEIYAMTHPGRACDETSFIKDVADHNELAFHEFRPEPVGRAPYEAQTRAYLDMPDYPNNMMHRGYWADARERGCRALFTGKGPDEWLSGSPYSLADDLKAGNFASLLDLGRSARRTGLGVTARQLWTYGVRPQIPLRLPAIARSALGRTVCPDFVRPDFCRSIHLEERLRRRSIPGTNFALAHVATAVSSGWVIHANELDNRAMASFGLEARDPFDDRRIVEFGLALPEGQRRRHGLSKFVLRQAMKGLIPSSVGDRPDKSDYSYLFAEEFKIQGGRELFANLELAARGWVDGERVLNMYEDMERNYKAGDPDYRRYQWPLWILLSLDRWLKS